MPRKYAEDTDVPVERSQAEIKRLLIAQGATQYGIVEDTDTHQALIAFRLYDRHVRIMIPLPRFDDPAIKMTDAGRVRPTRDRQAAFDQEMRRRWRVALIRLKIKLEAVAEDPAAFQDEFLAHLLLPDGRTVGQWAGPELADVYREGRLPSLLPGTPLRLLPEPKKGASGE